MQIRPIYIYDEPGISKDCLYLLSEKAKNVRSEGKELFVSLCLDEMAIRRHIYWSNAKKNS